MNRSILRIVSFVLVTLILLFVWYVIIFYLNFASYSSASAMDRFLLENKLFIGLTILVMPIISGLILAVFSKIYFYQTNSNFFTRTWLNKAVLITYACIFVLIINNFVRGKIDSNKSFDAKNRWNSQQIQIFNQYKSGLRIGVKSFRHPQHADVGAKVTIDLSYEYPEGNYLLEVDQNGEAVLVVDAIISKNTNGNIELKFLPNQEDIYSGTYVPIPPKVQLPNIIVLGANIHDELPDSMFEIVLKKEELIPNTVSATEDVIYSRSIVNLENFY